MKNIIRATISVIASAAILTSITGCCEDEPYVVPNPDPAQPVVTGIVTTNGGAPLPGATVTLTGSNTYTALTGIDGTYSVIVAPGPYSICASCDGTTSATDQIVAVLETTILWNAAILTPVECRFLVVDENDNHIEVIYPPVYNDESQLRDMITFDVPAGTVADDDSLIVVFSFNSEFVDDTKASSGLARLLDIEYHTASGQPFLKPLSISAEVPAEPVRALFNGEKCDYTFDSDAGKISFTTQEGGRLTLDYDIIIEETAGDPEPLDMDPCVWDNFYGDAPIRVLNPEYTMSVGGYVEGSNTLLNTFASAWSGLTIQSYKTLAYPLDVTLPVGTKLTISGYQTAHSYIFHVVDQNDQSEIVLTSRTKDFSSAWFDVEIRDRVHIGGSN